MSIDFEKLAAKFTDSELEWRIQTAGKKRDGKGIYCIIVPYITNRAIMDRLDAVCGPAGWCNEFAAGPSGGVTCGITLDVEGVRVTKWDGAENTEIEGVKGGLSNAMKRAAVQWGIGRYLYDLPTVYAEVADARPNEQGWEYGKLPQKNGGDQFWWRVPPLPRKYAENDPPNGKKHEPRTSPDQDAQQEGEQPDPALTTALTAIGRADSKDQLDRYRARVVEKHEKKEYSDQQRRVLFAACDGRASQLLEGATA